MTAYALPALIALLAWWLSTGVILYLVRRPRRTFRWTMLGATCLLAPALYGLAVSSADPGPVGAYLAFACGLLVWAWSEIGFLLGFVTGPRKEASAADRGGWRHAVQATEAILYHELAILASGLAVLTLTWGGANQVGAWTFAILWVMRLSAKLNVFLGVPNLSLELVPQHLRYLEDFMRRRPINPLFPLTVTAATAVTALLIAAAAVAEPQAAVGLTLLATLMALAVLEHWFLVLPLPDAALWRWATRERSPRGNGRRAARLDALCSALTDGGLRPTAASTTYGTTYGRRP